MYTDIMKFVGNLLLVFLFVPLFLITILAFNVKFQILDINFWQTTFRTNNVYSQLASSTKGVFEAQTIKEGGSLPDVRILTDLITPGNLQDLIEKNLVNTLNFANGKVKEEIIYIPIKILPKGLLPTDLGKISENTPLTTLLMEFNVQGISKTQVENISIIGQRTDQVLFFGIAFLCVILIVFFLMVENRKHFIPLREYPGRKPVGGSEEVSLRRDSAPDETLGEDTPNVRLGSFIGPSVALIISGLLTLTSALFVGVIKSNILTDWKKSSESVQIILSSFAPYVLQEILNTWILIGACAVFIGIILLFLKKR